MSDDKYVVIEYTDAAGGWAGNRYITGSRGLSLDSLNEELGERQKVIAYDVEMPEAQRLVSAVPVECLVAAAFEECTIEGKVDPFMLSMQLQTNAFAAGESARQSGVPSRLASLQYGMAVINHIRENIEDPEEKMTLLDAINKGPSL